MNPAIIGFAFPLIFVAIFILIRKRTLSVGALVAYAALIYVGSLALGIGATILLGVGSIFAGAIFPIILLGISLALTKSKEN